MRYGPLKLFFSGPVNRKSQLPFGVTAGARTGSSKTFSFYSASNEGLRGVPRRPVLGILP